MSSNKQAEIISPFPASEGGVEIFDEFFSSGMEESVSPFLTPPSRPWGKNLSLKIAILSACLLLLSYFFSFFDKEQALARLFLLFTYFLAGIPALIASIEDIFDLEINIDVLMTLAAFLSILIGSGQEGALLLVLFSISGAMEEAVRSKAKGAIQALKQVAPTKAYLVDSMGKMHERSVRDIQVGAKIHIPAGEIVPLDGEVIIGETSINLVHLTGENFPIVKKVGDEVVAGARNLEGAITIAVTKKNADSTLTQILNLILRAQKSKPKLERWLDKITRSYATTIIALSILVTFAFPLIFSLPFLGVEGSLYRALAFLIAASPCALIIAIPTAYLSAVSICAKKGILLKGGVVLDALTACKIVAFDKTGTLTEGDLTFLGVENLSQEDENEALAIAASLEQSVIHPIAKALIQEAEKRTLPLVSIENFKSYPGRGVSGHYRGQALLLGNRELIFPKISPTLQREVIKKLEGVQENLLFSFFLKGDNLVIFKFKDILRKETPRLIENLRKRWKLRILMLTGDHYESAKRIAQEAGVEEFFANLRPEEKLFHIDNLAQKTALAMVGDGINDAPSLARATVGISMGKRGSATAVDASDIVLLHDNLEHLEWLFAKAAKTKKIVNQNLCFALAAIIIATIPSLLGWIPLWAAVLMHEGGTVLVGLNALRLLKT